MRGTSRVFGIAMTAAMLVALAAASAALAGPGAAKPRKPKKPKTTFSIVTPSQSALAARGVRVNVRVRMQSRRGTKGKPVRIKVLGSSATYDSPKFTKLTKTKALKFRKSGKRTVSLPLTASGGTAAASCTARTIRVQIGKTRKTADLQRTGSCAAGTVDLSRASYCDFIGEQASSRCLLPFPDDYYTVADPDSATGRMIDLHTKGMPDNAAGKRIDASPYLGNDGFSPGESILVRVPGLDNPAALAQTDAAPINHIGRYADADQPVVVIDAATGERQPIWTEIDSNATSPDTTVLEVHPAVNFASGHRYIVAMRDLKRSDGSVIDAPAGFRYYRDELASDQGVVNSRRDHFEELFSKLRDAGIQRSNLYLAWDFTVASDLNIARRALHIRDDAFASVLGDSNLADGVVSGTAPAFNVTDVDLNTDAELSRRVRGTFTVPCYLTNGCQPGGVFTLDGQGNPVRQGNYTANFDCIIPKNPASTGVGQNLRPATYGHGLFGGAGEVKGSPTNRTLAQQHGFIMCATDEIGMSGADIPNTYANILPDLSGFPQLADRLQQGLLNELFLGRLMDNPAGFASVKAFHSDQTEADTNPNVALAPNDGVNPSVIDTSQFYYIGASQGGIMGGALTALSPDSTRTVLNVPAMNYSVLLPRSVDYAPFAVQVNANYDEIERPLALDLIQMLWDRGEPNGYAHRMTTDPLPNTPAHKVLMNVAFGDHQVTNFQADVEARTIGAFTRDPVIYPGRWPDVDILWNVKRYAPSELPQDGSAVIYGDIGPLGYDPMNPTFGVAAPPLTNTPNSVGEDPHGAPRGAPQAIQLMSDFLAPNGKVTNVCGSTACFAGGFPGP